MRDGFPPRRSTTPLHTWTPSGVQVDSWRRTIPPLVLRAIADQTQGVTLTRPLLHALLDELHIGEGFDALIGPEVGTMGAAPHPSRDGVNP